ncbi:RNA 2'-phosphotransferase [Hymenobacter persicinus]|uniref:Probable RNA 2'-phosphotransferase n=1 Tax=Hymenobacter persicinus TaxID=2025506 RepID=A0A4Q5LEU6_9BACT|nr:RNA 2'-phosphotransferase [Hymenobacter persicinus]RYU79068.1 RNA 2'-phosphotransferase [Hymenobacter persicinus]
MNNHDLSKLLSYVLRHKPEELDLTLDEQGWVAVPLLLAAIRRRHPDVTHDQLLEVVASSEKQRFGLSDDGGRIRANQGHSVAVDLGLTPATPPEHLYHGTATRFLDSIRASGLQRGTRQHVHLSADVPTAVAVGSRHGKPLVLTVRAGELHQRGAAFYLSANGVWLTDAVPPEFLHEPWQPT